MGIFVYTDEMPAGIYYNSSLSVISISADSIDWYTIADRNLWATNVWSSYMWNIYQWWNNYWFPNTWGVTTSSSWWQATWKWPSNPYNNSTFRFWTSIRSYDWAMTTNNNLWWWTSSLVTDHKWPCATWYHVPTGDEWDDILDELTEMWLTATSNNLATYLYLWVGGGRDYSSGNITRQTEWLYWCCDAGNTRKSKYLNITDVTVSTKLDWNRAYGFQIRPFKDAPVSPDNTWTVLYQKP